MAAAVLRIEALEALICAEKLRGHECVLSFTEVAKEPWWRTMKDGKDISACWRQQEPPTSGWTGRGRRYTYLLTTNRVTL